jgi:DNA polymerase I
MPDNKLFLIDALAYIYRSYEIARSKGVLDNKLLENEICVLFYGMLTEIIKKEIPSHFAVVFDVKKPTFRHLLYAKYKANRKNRPEAIVKAIDKIKTGLSEQGIIAIEKEGYEADDLIGTLAKRFGSNKMKVYIVSPDKDFMQLVDENIFIYKMKKNGKIPRIIDAREIRNTWLVCEPVQLIDIFTFAGDETDHIPGIHGFGKRIVKQLLGQFGNIDGMYANLDKIPLKYRELLITKKEDILLSKKLITIDLQVPLEISLDELKVNF